MVYMKTFEELGIVLPLIQKLAERSITVPSQVQDEVLPHINSDSDVLFRAATGSGKTLAYLLPILQDLEANTEQVKAPQVIIVAPTFELCAQIKNEAQFYGSVMGKPISTALFTGDANTNRQIERLKKDKPQILVGTASRFLFLNRIKKLDLRKIRWCILDEADRLCADELWDATRDLLKLLPAERKTIGCSATMDRTTTERLTPFLRPSFQKYDLDDSDILREKIFHIALLSEQRKKITVLRSLLNAEKPEKTLVFTDRNGQIANIASQLLHHGFSVAGLFGDMDKVERKKAVDDFRAGRKKVLVTSDLSARGLDIPGVTHVVELDVPSSPAAYAHRAGRTGRAGMSGTMLTIGTEDEMYSLATLEKKLRIVMNPRIVFNGKLVQPVPISEDDTFNDEE